MGTSIDAQNVLITHENCWDGAACSVVYKKFFPGGHVIETNYKKIPINIYLERLACKDVIVADFSMSREDLLKLKEVTKSLVVLDHHITAMKDLEGLDFAIFDMKKCGSRMLYDYLMSLYHEKIHNKPSPEAADKIPFWLEMVEAGDLYKTYVSFFDAYRGVRILHHEDRHDYLDSLYTLSDQQVVERLFTEGMPAFEAYSNNLKDQLNPKSIFSFKCTLHGKEICIPAIIAPPVFSSDGGHHLANLTTFKVGLVVQLDLKEKMARLSFRSVGHGNASLVAMSLGGGGHTHAAGASISIAHALRDHIVFNQDWKKFEDAANR